jgi:hypothetical protein
MRACRARNVPLWDRDLHARRICVITACVNNLAMTDAFIAELSARGHNVAAFGSAAFGELSVGNRAPNEAIDVVLFRCRPR